MTGAFDSLTLVSVCMCQDEAEADKDDDEPGSLMSCLIKKKHYSDMNEKCRAGVEHYQLVCLSVHMLVVVVIIDIISLSVHMQW